MSDGQAWEHVAFLPNPLAEDEPELTGATYRAVSTARAAIAALDATAAQLPNPQLFRRSTLRVEAQSTSALEGTFEPLERVLSEDPDEVDDPSLREVLNYVDVASMAFASVQERRPWTVSWLSELQGLLLRGTAGECEASGRVRPMQVAVGRREDSPTGELRIKAARYVPPPPGHDLHARLQDLLTWMQTDHGDRIDPVVATALAHYTFEALHPFHDGNGRLGRLLVVPHLQTLGLLTEPTLSVSPWFEARRTEYYDALLGVSTNADWSTWVGLFARGLASSADTTRQRMLDLTAVQMKLHEAVRFSGMRTANAPRLMDFAVGHPTFTAAQAARALELTPTGAMKLITSLVDRGILASAGPQTYRRRFYAPEVLRVLLSQPEQM